MFEDPKQKLSHEVVTWGDPEAGGDSSLVQDKLKNVKAVKKKSCLAGFHHCSLNLGARP